MAWAAMPRGAEVVDITHRVQLMDTAPRVRRLVLRHGAPGATVLLALDDERAEAAIEVAIQLAAWLEARVAVAELVGGSGPAGSGTSRAPWDVVGRLRDRGVDAATATHPRLGDGRLRVLRDAWDARAEVVVLGLRPKPGLDGLHDRLLLRDLLSARWPVLWVPTGASRAGRTALDPIVVAVAGDEPATHAACWSATLARGAGARVVLVHVCTPAPPAPSLAGGACPWVGDLSLLAAVDGDDRCRRELEGWVARVRSTGVDARSQLRRGPVAPEIAAGADEVSAGLVVVGARRHPGWLAQLRQPIGERVVRAGSRPVLIVP